MPALSIVMCTRNRAGSFAITLDCLSRNEREGIGFEVIVEDNASSPHRDWLRGGAAGGALKPELSGLSEKIALLRVTGP